VSHDYWFIDYDRIRVFCVTRPSIDVSNYIMITSQMTSYDRVLGRADPSPKIGKLGL
jgi:hypothetical protein